MNRWFACLTLLGLLLLPAAARPADAKKADTTPTVVLRIRSIDTVIDNAKFLAGLAGKEEVGKQIEALIKTKVGPNGLEGIDTRRPLGVYGKVAEDPTEFAGVVMVPIADEKAFLGLLENLNVKATKNNDGLYTIQQDVVPVQIAFRFANNYAYFTAQNLQAVSRGNLLAPAQIFPAGLTADISGSVRLDQIPKAFRDLGLNRLEDEIAKAKDRKEPGETEAQQKVRIASLDAFYQQASEVLRNGREVAGQLTINREKKDLVVEMTLDAVPGTPLGKEIGKVAEGHSLFAGLLGSGDVALAGLFHATLPRDVSRAMEAAIEEGFGKALEKVQEEGKREQMEKFIKAIKPTLLSGTLDAGFVLRGPSAARHYTLVGGVKLKEGEQIEKAVRQALKDAPAKDREKVKLDVDSVGNVAIHRLDVQEGYDKASRDLFGDNPIYVAFRQNALLVGLGENGLDALKAAIPMKGQASPPLLLEVAVARLAQTAAKTDEQKKVVRDVFTGDDQGRIRITLEGGPALRLRFETALSVLQFAAQYTVKTEASSGN